LRGRPRRLGAVRDEFPVPALVPEAAVEALAGDVLPRAARVDGPGSRPPLGQPALQDLGDEFRSVVRAEPFRRALLGERPLQDGDAPPGAERGPDLDGQALPRVFVDQREDPQRLAVRTMILEDVIGPGVIGALGSDRHRVAAAATPSAAATRPWQAQA